MSSTTKAVQLWTLWLFITILLCVQGSATICGTGTIDCNKYLWFDDGGVTSHLQTLGATVTDGDLATNHGWTNSYTSGGNTLKYNNSGKKVWDITPIAGAGMIYYKGTEEIVTHYNTVLAANSTPKTAVFSFAGGDDGTDAYIQFQKGTSRLVGFESAGDQGTWYIIGGDCGPAGNTNFQSFVVGGWVTVGVSQDGKSTTTYYYNTTTGVWEVMYNNTVCTDIDLTGVRIAGNAHVNGFAMTNVRAWVGGIADDPASGPTYPTITNQKNYTNDYLTWIMSAQSDQTGSCTLYGNWSGSWAKNETKAVVAATAFNFTVITFSGANQNYFWGINCTGTTSETWGSNYTFSTPKPVVTLVTPATGNLTERDVNLTFTVGTIAADNCTLWDNRTGSWAAAGYSTTGTVASHDFGKTGLSSTGKYLWGVRCVIGTTPYWSATNNTLIVDATYPTITLNPSNEWKTTNLSANNPYDDNFLINITFAEDRDLDQILIEVNKSGTSYFRYYNDTSGLAYTFSNLTNISTWIEGTYNIMVQVSDSHTANLIGDYVVEPRADKLTFKTQEKNEIEISSDDPSSTTAYKKFDRYEFGFDFSDGLVKDRIFNIKSKYPIKYKADSKYVGHFVVYSAPGVGNWIDFEGLNKKPKVTKINDYYYTVEFKDVSNNVKFESIGGLNVLTAYYTWYRGNYSTLAPTGYSYEDSYIYLNVSKESSISDVNATLIYNSTSAGTNTKSQSTTLTQFYDTVTNPSYASNNTYYWTVTVMQSDGENWTFDTRTFTHMVLSWTLDGCSATSTQVLRFANYIEPFLNTAQNVSYEINIKYWLTTPSVYKNYSAEVTNVQNITLCATKNMYADVYVQYKATDGFTHRWLLYNQSIVTASMLTQKIYNYNYTTGVSTLRITARDQDSFSYFKDAVVTLQHYYPSLNQWTSVQMGETDDYGFVFFNILEKGTDYRLIFKDKSNNLLKITETLTFSCDSSVCSILALLTPYSATTGANNVSVSYSYSNITNILTISWTSGLDVSLTAAVSKETGKGTTSICNYYTSSTTSGSTTCNLSGYSGLVYLQINSTYSGQEILNFGTFIDVGTQKLYRFIDKEEGAFYAFAIMCIVVGFGIWSPVAVVISALFGLIVIYFLGLVSAVSFTLLSIAIVMGIIISLKLRT